MRAVSALFKKGPKMRKICLISVLQSWQLAKSSKVSSEQELVACKCIKNKEDEEDDDEEEVSEL